MENAIVDLFHLQETTGMTVGAAENKSAYISCIKIHGKPILPPVLNEERRNELRGYKQKAIEIELKLLQQKKKGRIYVASEVSSIPALTPSRQSTPARPVSLNLKKKYPGRNFVLSKSKTMGSLIQHSKQLNSNQRNSRQTGSKKLEKTFRSTLEQRIAMTQNIGVKNKQNKCQKSLLVEKQTAKEDVQSEKCHTLSLGSWSPLKVEPLDSFRIELTCRDAQESDDVLEISQDKSERTPEIVTHTPNLMRQNSYTLLTPSPALLSFLESQKHNWNQNDNGLEKRQKTCDTSGTKRTLFSNVRERQVGISLNGDRSSDEMDVQSVSRKYSSSLDDFSGAENSLNTIDYDEYSGEDNSPGSDSCVSQDSCDPHNNLPEQSRVRCKIKGKKTGLLNCVPSFKSSDAVHLKADHLRLVNQTEQDFMPSLVEAELPELSSLLLKMKVDHDRQKKELERKQKLEIKQLEIIYKKREAELLSKVDRLPLRSRRSIYSEKLRGATADESDSWVMGDGNHNQGNFEKFNSYQFIKRPQSAKDYHRRTCSFGDDSNRRAKSMDFNEGSQATDLDISFQDEFVQSKDTTLNNEFVMGSDTISNFSSRSSTFSSDNRPDLIPNIAFRKYHEITSEDYAKYNQAATIINAGVRGFLTRRLLRTAHVQGLITTLKDAITCATQLHTASDIADSDIDLMRRLGRQIEAAWDAVYIVFFSTETTVKLQMIAADRERLKVAIAKSPLAEVKKSISSATRKSLDRKKAGSVMSKSQTPNCTRVRMCTKLTASYPSPYFSQKL
ncbi:hypothetical protein RUM44_008871 [Polyplax serrata]|uniref:Uncharacterized protein n=1 Tax=Polyplax serrata TaxID=468196 RepID=A0ABR1B9U9_POLSC